MANENTLPLLNDSNNFKNYSEQLFLNLIIRRMEEKENLYPIN